MTKQLSLLIIFLLAILGMLFSGYLSFGELVRKKCSMKGGCSNVGSVPACVYGFIMYTIVLVISILGLLAE